MSVSKIFGLSQDKGIASVAQQLEIWEKEMNCIQDYKGLLIKFENSDQHKEFKVFKARKRIACWLWNDEWKEGGENVVVVDIKYERESYEFINNCTK